MACVNPVLSISGESTSSYSTNFTTPDLSPQICCQEAGIDQVPCHRALPDPTNPTTPLHIIRNIATLGAPSAAIIALNTPSVSVTVVDKDDFRIRRWNSTHLPIHEPGLQNAVRIPRDGLRSPRHAKRFNDPLFEYSTDCESLEPDDARQPNLFFTTGCAKAIAKADMIFIAVNTPTKTVRTGAGYATDMTSLESSARLIASHAKDGAILIEKSTVPFGTAGMVRNILDAVRPGARFEILSNPEFLSEGQAIQNLQRPDRILIGCDQTLSGRRAASALARLYSTWVPRRKILCTNVWFSELAKLGANAMLAQRINSINSISEICERTGADVHEIAKSVGLDARIGSQFLKAGLGFGGSCFRKDIASLVYLAQSLGLNDVADYWNAVNHINDLQRNRFARNVISRLNTTLVNKKITLLGFAFKKNTDDPRESLAIDIIWTLLEEMPGEIAIFDPGCNSASIEREVRQLQAKFGPQALEVVSTYADPYEACSNADAILIMTDWDLFKTGNSRGKNHDASHTPDPRFQDLPASAISANNTAVPLEEQFLPEPPCPPECPEYPCPSATTEFDTSSRLDWKRIDAHMKEPRWVFDGRAVLDITYMEKLGFKVEALGVASGRTS